MHQISLLLMILSLLISCKEEIPGNTDDPGKDMIFSPSSAADWSTTYPQPDGNRIVEGKGNIQGTVPFSISLGGKPDWIAGLPAESGNIWVVVLSDGEVKYFMQKEDALETLSGTFDPLPAGMPPYLMKDSSGSIALLNDQLPSNASPLTTPVLLSDRRMAYITDQGSLVVQDKQIAVDALPDARLLVDEEDRILLLTQPTDDYKHAVLGDGTEARGFALFETVDGSLVKKIEVQTPDQSVIEGIAPIWTDLDSDGTREIIVTLSGNADGPGARIVVYSESGDILAKGHLSPGGWRHQLAVASMGGKTVILDVQKPHVDRLVDVYEMVGDTLLVLDKKQGYSTHQLGLRNLDMALVADMDGAGEKELIVPHITYNSIHGLAFDGMKIEEKWSQALPGRISTNIASVNREEKLSLAVGTENGELLVW